jgi:glyoxylase-like metal-dependent hydrolase (beta-lactamase superfamily II)
MIETGVFEQVTQIRMGREINGSVLYRVSAYLVDGLLIDTGCSYTSAELVAFMSDKPVNAVVNTHFHEDHIGANKAIIDQMGIEIHAPGDSVPLIAQKPFLYPYQEMVWGYPEPTVVKPLGDVIRTKSHIFDVVETPGHSIGHVALMEKAKGWCFSGDLFSRETIKFIRPEENAGELVDSMRKILSLAGDRLVLFTSVGKIIEDGRTALNSCISYLTGLAERVKKMSAEGLDEDGILKEVFGGEHNFARLTNGQYTSMNLVRSLLKM